MNLIALLLVPVIISPLGDMTLSIITGVAIIALGYAVWYSKRGSIGSEMAAAAAESAK